MGKGYRTGRLGEEIRKIVSEMLISGIKDPRLTNNMVSISGVDVTNDGSYATVFLTVLGYGQQTPETKAKQENDALEALKHAKGVIKKEIGKQIKLRHIPELIFKIDTSLEYGRHIEEVLHNLNK
jgi:ribosome-binding factor A